MSPLKQIGRFSFEVKYLTGNCFSSGGNLASAGPGLGIDIDVERVRKYQMLSMCSL